MTKSITVHQASADDANALGEIHAESWKAAYVGFFPPDFAAEAVRHRRTKWHDVLAKGEDTVMVAVLNGRPLALSFFGRSRTRPGSAEIFSFFGHPEGWGTGVASAVFGRGHLLGQVEYERALTG